MQSKMPVVDTLKEMVTLLASSYALCQIVFDWAMGVILLLERRFKEDQIYRT